MCWGEYAEGLVTLQAHVYVHVLMCVFVGEYQRLNSVCVCVCLMCLGWDELGLGAGEVICRSLTSCNTASIRQSWIHRRRRLGWGEVGTERGTGIRTVIEDEGRLKRAT